MGNSYHQDSIFTEKQPMTSVSFPHGLQHPGLRWLSELGFKEKMQANDRMLEGSGVFAMLIVFAGTR
jgi:hypothetical protein